jgi:hypothetical protein
MLDEAAVIKSPTGDSCVVIMDVLRSDLSVSLQDEKQKPDKKQ